MPWKPEVYVERRWTQNQLVFATEQEAKRYAYDLFQRWTKCEDSRAVEVDDAVVNSAYHDNMLVQL